MYGKFLFLGRAVDSTLLCPVSAITSQSSALTEDTMKQTLEFLDYVATQEEAVLTYNASETKVAAHSDTSYLSEPKLSIFYRVIHLCHTTTEQY